jgi:hypothetical protein
VTPLGDDGGLGEVTVAMKQTISFRAQRQTRVKGFASRGDFQTADEQGRSSKAPLLDFSALDTSGAAFCCDSTAEWLTESVNRHWLNDLRLHFTKDTLICAAL